MVADAAALLMLTETPDIQGETLGNQKVTTIINLCRKSPEGKKYFANLLFA